MNSDGGREEQDRRREGRTFEKGEEEKNIEVLAKKKESSAWLTTVFAYDVIGHSITFTPTVHMVRI